VNLVVVRRATLEAERREHRLRDACGQLGRRLGFATATEHVGNSDAISFSSSFGLRQKRSKRLLENGQVLVLRNEHRCERSTKIVAIVEADRPDRFERRERARRSHGNPR
jgi:hypothetical protein